MNATECARAWSVCERETKRDAGYGANQELARTLRRLADCRLAAFT